MISSNKFKAACRRAFIRILLYGFFSCSVPFTRSASSITTVEYCDLLNNPALYDGKDIRLHGTYAVAGNADLFFISSCGIEKRLWVEFNSDYQSCSNKNAIKALNEMRRKSGVSWKRPHVSALIVNLQSAEVEFVGKFTGSNPYKQTNSRIYLSNPNPDQRELYDFVFNVSCIESVQPLAKIYTK